MSAAPVTTLFAGGLGVTYALLQLRVGLYRKNHGPMFGTQNSKHEEDLHLTAISRAGGNFQEYVPSALGLMYLMETQAKVPRNWLLAYGATLAGSRLALALAHSTANLPAWQPYHLGLRAPGFLATIVLIAGAGAFLVRWALKG